MMKNMKRVLVFFAVILGIALYFLYAAVTATSIIIYNTNDLHGHILSSAGVGGSAVLSNYLKDQKKPYLLLDAGDTFQGTPEGDLSNGEAVIKVMNELGYDAMTLGNHDLDKGQTQLKKLIEMANFAVLGANVIDKRTGQIFKGLEPYYIKEINGVRVGVLGLTTSKMRYITMPQLRKGMEFQNEVDVAKKYIPELKKKADVIIALTHIGLADGNDDDIFLAQNTDGIDIIVGGHSHTNLRKPIYVKDTMIVQTGGLGKSVGKITIEIKNRKILSKRYSPVYLRVKKFGEDEKMTALIQNLTKNISAKMETIVGSSAQKLSHYASGRFGKSGEIPLGNWQADVFRITTNSNIGFQNSGGIRADLPEGNLTLRNMYELAPFGNTIYTLNLTGAQIKNILEKSVSGKFGMLQVSGLKFKYDANKDAGQRVVEITVGNDPINPKKYYKVATNSFVATGGDDYNIFKQGKNIHDTGIIDREVELSYLRSHSPIVAKKEGRIVAVP